jgi:membrane-associated phospholipid phosphatase
MKKRLAELTSNIFNPFLVSLVVILLLAFKATASTMDALKWALISIALSVLPVLLVVVCLVRRRKLDSIFAQPRRQRTGVYLLSVICAIIGFIVLRHLGAPKLLVTTFVAGLATIIIFMSINLTWKISLHTAFAAASVTVVTIVYGSLGALTAVLLLPVGWARIELEHHSPTQVIIGGLLAAVIVFLVFYLSGLTGSTPDAIPAR